MPRSGRTPTGTNPVRILVAQASPVVGDVEGNAQACISAIADAARVRARMMLTTELALSGYPPRDLLEREDLTSTCHDAALRVAAATAGTDVIAIFGTPWRDGGLRNAAVIAAGGRIVATRYKSLLPTYDVFDEARWFVPESDPAPVEIDGLRIGVTICEDIWNEPGIGPHYAVDPLTRMLGCDVVVNLSASPFHAGKGGVRLALLRRKAERVGCPVVYANMVGGNDELLFDGNSMAVAADGRLLGRAKQWAPDALLVDTDEAPPDADGAAGSFEEEVVEALTMGVRDYAARCGFRTALIGLSGGIDSALVATLAVRALGADRVVGVGMPGPFSSPGSVSDARSLADRLGMAFSVVPIDGIVDAFGRALNVAPGAHDVTAQNLQARARGTILMGLSNRDGHLLLTTGNKSEMAVGYCTLYGDMNGGLAVIGDVFKTDVYRIARWLNREREIIPASTLEKPPSAELAPDQTDQDSLPPYAVLDAILHLYVEGVVDPDAIVARGHPRELVERVVRMVVRSEYKRWQAAPVLRVSPRAFGSGRRIPLAQRWN